MVIIDTVYNKYFDVYSILWTLFRFWIYIFNISFNVNYDINLILWSIQEKIRGLLWKGKKYLFIYLFVFSIFLTSCSSKEKKNSNVETNTEVKKENVEKVEFDEEIKNVEIPKNATEFRFLNYNPENTNYILPTQARIE